MWKSRPYVCCVHCTLFQCRVLQRTKYDKVNRIYAFSVKWSLERESYCVRLSRMSGAIAQILQHFPTRRKFNPARHDYFLHGCVGTAELQARRSITRCNVRSKNDLSIYSCLTPYILSYFGISKFRLPIPK